MRMLRCPLAGLALTGVLVVAPALHAQSFGVAAGVAAERRMTTGGLVQLSYFRETALQGLGLRFDALYAQQPPERAYGFLPDGTRMGVATSATRTYGMLGALTYRVGRSAAQPYVVLGTGFYSRDSYTGGFALGANAGVGTTLRIGRLQLFGETRIHTFNHVRPVPWAQSERIRFVPITLGVRF